MLQTFDIIVIGGGPGGYVSAIRASQLGKKVALIEEKHLGGICLNWGCIPTKALLRTGEIYHFIKNTKNFGLSSSSIKINWEYIIQRSRNISQKLALGISHLMKKNKITVFNGRGFFQKKDGLDYHILVKGENTKKLSSQKIIIATGARAKKISELEVNSDRIWTYREALLPSKQPKSLLIVGSGAIGIEFASFYSEMGSDVTVIEVKNNILPSEDSEISSLARKAFEKRGIRILTNTNIISLISKEDFVSVKCKSDKGFQNFEVDKVLLAVGISPNVENLGLESIKIKFNGGHIETNSFAETSELGIYAIGDVAGPPWLAHKASHEGVIAVEHAFKVKDVHPLNVSNIPGCTYSFPQIASVGLTEESAKKLGYKIKVGRFSAVGNGKALALGETDEGFVKVVFNEDTGELLGAHMIGSEVTEQIQGFVLARTLEATEKEIMNTIFPHPTLSEMMHEATLEAFGKAIHI